MTKKNIFYGLHRKTILKKELLYFLANRDDFVSSKEIANKLDLGTSQQAQLLYHELKDDIAEYYKENEFEVIINQTQGVRLLKHHGDIHLLINEYHYTELSFRLMVQLYYSRVLDTFDFCTKLFVSEATLRRRIKRMNENLKPFQLKVTCSRRITLVGNEKDIRAFYTLSSYSIFRTLSNLPEEYTEREQHLEDGKAVAKVLKFIGGSFNKVTKDMISLFFVTQAYHINQGYSLTEQPETIAPIDWQLFPRRPRFLIKWTDNDWYFFLFSIYLFDLYEPKGFGKSVCQSEIYATRGEDWERLFKKYFRVKSMQNQVEARRQLARLLLFKTMYPDDNYIFKLFPILSFTKQASRYPLHTQRFEGFWNEYIELYPMMNTYHFKTNCLLLTLYLTPLSDRKEEIRIYVESKFSTQYTEFLKTSLIDYFYSRYHLKFVLQKAKADIVLSTVKNLLPETEDGSTYIHPLIPETDYELIESRINEVIEHRRSEEGYEIKEEN